MNAVGMGYDVHRFISGRPLILGGVQIEHPFGLDGHSDADVLCHAIADALLGAVGAGDIGEQFPNTDPSIKGISSLDILKRVRVITGEKYSDILNVDATVVAEQPKIGPHVSKMKEAIAAALEIPATCIGIKATTNERMGFIGRGEGIAALAVACVDRR